MKLLRRTQFGNPILRLVTRQLEKSEIKSAEIQELIANMEFTLETKKYGVGLAAPQVGQSVAVSVIAIKPTKNRPDVKPERLVIINPEIVTQYGRRKQMWEGCLSFGAGWEVPYARVPRYTKIRLKYFDEHAKLHEKDFDGLMAHILQHETDHLQGILFVDKVVDTTSYVTLGEYQKRYRPKPGQK